MKRKLSLMLSLTALVFVSATFWTPTKSFAQEDGFAGRTITGTVYFIGGRRPARSLPFRLVINRLTTADEMRQLNSGLQGGGQDELLRTLSRMNAGRIQIGSGIGVPANAIVASDAGRGRKKLTVIYERYMQFAELRYGARSTDYPFGYAEMYVGLGDDQGMLIPAARIRLRDGNTWEVEDFGTYPARLMGLQLRGRGRVS